MKKVLRFSGIVCLFLLFAFAAAQQVDEPLIEVKSQVDTATVTIGDHIRYSIIIDRKKGVRIIQPGQGINLGQFEIKDYDFHEPQEKDGRIIERYDYVIAAYDTGRFTIPPYPLAYFPSSADSVPSIIEAPAIEIYVKSVLKGEEAPQLKDIKPPIDIPFNYRRLLVVLLILLLVGGAIFFAYRLWKRKQEKGYLFTPPPPPPPAHEQALADLQKLFASDLLQNEQFKEFFTRLSEIIRTYLERRYFIAALEETSSEILNDLQEHISEDELKDLLKDILTVSDLIKFARYRPQPDEVERIKNEAVAFVERTKIVYEPPVQEETADEVPEVAGNLPEGSSQNDK